MDITKLIRDKDKVLSNLKKVAPGKALTTKGCKIIIPVRFVEHELAYVGTDVYTVGNLVCIVDDTYFSVMYICAMVQLKPTSISRIRIGRDEFYQFNFRPGSTVIENTHLVRIDTVPYLEFNEFISKGRFPWYMPYEENGKVFDTSIKHAGADVGEFSETIELLVSLIARNPKNLTEYYRHTVKSYADMQKIQPAYVGLGDPRFGASDTLNRLGGSYAEDGIEAALLYPSEAPGRIETILRN